jgi:hypothetical protein
MSKEMSQSKFIWCGLNSGLRSSREFRISPFDGVEGRDDHLFVIAGLLRNRAQSGLLFVVLDVIR